jgi:hypothetical protein
MTPSADPSRAPAAGPLRVAIFGEPGGAVPIWKRRRVGFGAAGALAAFVLLLLLIGPLARSMAESRAAALGLRIVIRDAGLGFGSFRLSGVTLSAPELPGFAAELSRVDVAPGITLSPRRVTVRGGKVTLRGSTEELDRELHAFRAAHPSKRGGESRSFLPISATGVDVTWTGSAAGDQNVRGLRYERSSEGDERIGADMVRLASGKIRLDVVKPAIDVRRDADGRAVRTVAAERTSAIVDLQDAAVPVAPVHPVGTGAVAAAGTTGPEGTWSRLRAEVGRAATSVAEVVRPETKLELGNVRLGIRHGSEALNIGPAKVVVERDARAVKASITSGEGEHAPPLRFDVAVPLGEGAVDLGMAGEGAVDLGMAGGPLSLSALGVKEGDMGLEAVDRAEVEVNGRARLESDGSSVRVSGQARLSDLSVKEPRLSSEVVRGLKLGLGGEVDAALDGSHLRFTDVDVDVGKVKALASGELDRSEGHAKGKLHLEIPLAACSDMLSSVPPGLVPLLAGLEMSGTFAFSGDVSFDTRHPKQTRVTWDVANGCKITRVPVNLATERFARPWVRTVLGAGGIPTTIESGPGTPTWVPFYDISPYVATSVVVCEDANFWVHGGFNQKSIQDSIRDNLTAGRFVRGGSTVTMQLAKNLYLRREKTVSRKLQEAVLTLLLEQTLTKEQILELYLNVIEFAPGVYGIGPAALHYFKSRPRDLSLGQALYLISVLPNPKFSHFKPDGSLGEKWTEYLRHLMEIAHKIRRIDDRELATALAEVVQRGVPAAEGEASQDMDVAPPDRDDADGP